MVVSVLPLLIVSAGQADRQLGWLGRPGLGTWLQFLALSAAGLLLSRAAGERIASVALPLLIAPAGLLLTVSLIRPWYVERYVLYGMAGLALLTGGALDRALAERHRLPPAARILTACLLSGAAMAVLLPWSLHLRTPESRKDDVVAVARAVDRLARPGDGVLFLPARRREWLLSSPSVLRRLDDLALARSPESSHTLQGTELSPEAIRQRALAADRIIALADPPGEPLDPYPQEAVKREVLRDHFRVCERVRVRGAQITVHVRTTQPGCDIAEFEGGRGGA